MRRDIVFFVINLPRKILLQSKGRFFMAPISPDQMVNLKKGAELIPSLKSFLESPQAGEVFCVGVRNDCTDEPTAIAKAWKMLDGLIDGLSFVIDGELPEVCGAVQIREENQADCSIKLYGRTGWAHFTPPISDSIAKWQWRQDQLLKRLLCFFDAISTGDLKYKNDLCYQLAISVKMFKSGIQSKNFGIEFLSKFSALEGIVCGGRVSGGKEKTLKTRLASLFTKSARHVESEVEELWSLRCEASHEAKAFYDEELPDSKPLAIKIVLLEFYMTGALVFALDHVENITSISDLWQNSLPGYNLPEYALLERPCDMPKVPISNVTMPTNILFRGGDF